MRTVIIGVLIFYRAIFSQTLSGYVFNKKGKPLPWTNIYISDSNTGTVSNIEGRYILKLSSGQHSIVFSYLGYYSDTLDIKVNPEETITRNVYLSPYVIATTPVFVYGNRSGSTPDIILKAIRNKNNYLKKIKNYTYDAYTKTDLLVKRDSSYKIGGILQTQSKGWFQYPGNFHESILSRKQTRNFSGAYNIFTAGEIPNLMYDYISIDDNSFISPLNKDALSYYNYKIKDTTFYNGKRVFNFNFFPKNKSLPLFNGSMSIIDSSFAVVAASLNGGKRIQTSMKKKIKITENLREYENQFWLPMKIHLTAEFNMNFPGFPKIILDQVSVISNYKINDKNFNFKFDRNVLSESLLPKRESDSLWASNQSIVLTQKENRAAERIDSLVEHANPVAKLMLDVITLSPRISSLPITTFADFYHFNRVEGNYLGIGLDSKRLLGNVQLKAKYGYGFSDKKPKYMLGISYEAFDKLTLSTEFENQLDFANPDYKYSRDDISFQSLFDKDDYADYYYGMGLSASLNLKLNKQLQLETSYDDKVCRNAYNHTNWSFFYNKRLFRPPFAIMEGRIKDIGFQLTYDSRKYIELGSFNGVDESNDYLFLNAKLLLSSSKILESNFNFSRFYIDAQSLAKFSFFDLKTGIKAGMITGNLYRQYLFHLPGVYGTFSNTFALKSIQNDMLMGKQMLSVFAEINFRNYLFNITGLPLLKDSGYDLYVFADAGYLHNPQAIYGNKLNFNHDKYFIRELGIGIGNILSLFRIDFTRGWSNINENNFSITLGTNL